MVATIDDAILCDLAYGGKVSDLFDRGIPGPVGPLR